MERACARFGDASARDNGTDTVGLRREARIERQIQVHRQQHERQRERHRPHRQLHAELPARPRKIPAEQREEGNHCGDHGDDDGGRRSHGDEQHDQQCEVQGADEGQRERRIIRETAAGRRRGAGRPDARRTHLREVRHERRDHDDERHRGDVPRIDKGKTAKHDGGADEQ